MMITALSPQADRPLKNLQAKLARTLSHFRGKDCEVIHFCVRAISGEAAILLCLLPNQESGRLIISAGSQRQAQPSGAFCSECWRRKGGMKP
jgi:hypothetical protein